MMLQIGPMRQRSKNKGFTFIELVLVILIIAFLAALAVPMFRQVFNDMQFEQVSSDLAGALSFARANAIFTRSQCSVMINNSEQYFYIKNKNKVYYMPKGIKINSDKEGVFFYPDATSSDTITITLTNSNKTRTFTMEGELGYVKIK